MDFGYFTLSDNHYANNTRSSNQFVADITAEAIYADKLGMHSAWVGEHHFNSLGVLSCPDLVLAYVAANTSRIRLAPAVTVLPLHHPIRVAEQWATLDLLSGGRVDFACGRGYDQREYLPFHVSFADNQGIFEEGLELVRRLWAADDRISHHGKHYSFDDVRITPKPVQRPLPTYVGSFSKPSIELAARLGCGLIVAPFAAAISYGGLKQVADLYHETCAKHGTKPGRLMCSYFTHFADNKAQEDAQRARQNSLLQGVRDPGFPGRPEDGAAELSLFHRHGRAAAEGKAGGSNGKFRAARLVRAHHRDPEKGRGRRLRRGDPLFQCWSEAAQSGEGRNGALHDRGGARLRRRAQGARSVVHDPSWPGLSCDYRAPSDPSPTLFARNAQPPSPARFSEVHFPEVDIDCQRFITD